LKKELENGELVNVGDIIEVTTTMSKYTLKVEEEIGADVSIW
jgi:hypothetical protein